MKKKGLLVLAALVCIISVGAVSAKNLKNVYLYGAGQNTQEITKSSTEGNFHTAVNALSITSPSGSVSVSNRVYRRNAILQWTLRGNGAAAVAETYKSYPTNYSLGSTADTKAVWTNDTQGTTLYTELFINNGHE